MAQNQNFGIHLTKKFIPTQANEGNLLTRFQCLTKMPGNEDKSLEEHRLEFYESLSKLDVPGFYRILKDQQKRAVGSLTDEELKNLFLVCGICCENCTPPIPLCKNGHRICKICRPKVEECPFCRGQYLGTNDLAAAELFDKLNEKPSTKKSKNCEEKYVWKSLPVVLKISTQDPDFEINSNRATSTDKKDPQENLNDK